MLFLLNLLGGDPLLPVWLVWLVRTVGVSPWKRHTDFFAGRKYLARGGIEPAIFVVPTETAEGANHSATPDLLERGL